MDMEKNFKYTDSLIKKGKMVLQRTGATLAIVAVMGAPLGVKAYASVPSENILGDLQVSEDRSAIKQQDAMDIECTFKGIDSYGNNLVTTTKAQRAIELSDALNNYDSSIYYHTNTTKNEVLALDIDSLYQEYQYYKSIGQTNVFCANNLSSRPAIDAYTVFACGAMANQIDQGICSALYQEAISKGYNVTEYPTAYFDNGQVYCLIGINGQTNRIDCPSSKAQGIYSAYSNLSYHYNMALDSISGASEDYESSFCYNGIECNTNESVWLSLGDSQRKEDLKNGIKVVNSINNSLTNGYTITKKK